MGSAAIPTHMQALAWQRKENTFIERRKACQSTCPIRWVPHSSRGVPQVGITTSKKTLATEEVVCLQGKSSVQCTNIKIMTKTNSSWLFTESLSGKESFLFLLGLCYHYRTRELPFLVCRLCSVESLFNNFFQSSSQKAQR